MRPKTEANFSGFYLKAFIIVVRFKGVFFFVCIL